MFPLLMGCLLVVGSGTAHARYPDRPTSAVVDTWLVRGDHVVGRSQIGVTPAPTLGMSIKPGGERVLAWRVSNVVHAPTIVMDTDCESGGGFGLGYLTPKGEDVSSEMSHGGYTQTSVDAGTFRTLYLHIRAKRSGVNLSCVLRATGSGGFDKVLLDIASR